MTDTTASPSHFPSKPVRLIEPFGPGGGPDVVARSISPRLSELWGQPVLVENHPGAGATSAPAYVAASVADGHVLLVSTSAHAYSAALRQDLPYDPLESFIPIVPLTTQSYVLIAGRHAGLGTLTELIAAAMATPGTLRFASTGAGSGTHLAVEKLNLETGVRAVHVPAQAGESIADVIAGTISGRADYQMAPIALALADIHSGKLLALGVSGMRRSTLLPDVPTIAEAGVDGFDFPIWYGVWAPSATSGEVVEKLARDFQHALAASDVRDRLAAHGAEPMNMTQVEFARFVVAESRQAARLARALGSSPAETRQHEPFT
jgi:tripartite-type tricarboxylate transporter receptor subunit TctC